MAKKLIHTLFSRKADEVPNNIALSKSGDSVNYKELSLSSNQLSHLLMHLNFEPGDVVGTMLPSGIDLVSCVLGIMKLGGVYMPIEKGYSDRRIIQMLEESVLRFSSLLRQSNRM